MTSLRWNCVTKWTRIDYYRSLFWWRRWVVWDYQSFLSRFFWTIVAVLKPYFFVVYQHSSRYFYSICQWHIFYVSDVRQYSNYFMNYQFWYMSHQFWFDTIMTNIRQFLCTWNSSPILWPSRDLFWKDLIRFFSNYHCCRIKSR